jgi:hypothetical protein
MVSRAGSVFDDAGALKDLAIRKQLQEFLSGFVDFVRTGKSKVAV